MRKRYCNLDGVQHTKKLKDVRQWRKERKSKKKDVSFQIPQANRLSYDDLHSTERINMITWIGHSTFLLRLGGLNMITDPVWAHRMGWEKRLAPPGIPMEHMPDIDIVLISHSHYDHLHFPSLRKLKGSPAVCVPEGLGQKLRKKGFRHVHEMGWWQNKQIAEITLTFVPAQHWTRRTLSDMNTSHWGGWIVQALVDQHPLTIYFAGDSGYFHGFKQIGEQFDIDYALMPIGAYEPEWFMSEQHVTPEEAVQAYLDVKADYFVPMHYGAFRLADDTPEEALDRLYRAWDRQHLSAEKLQVFHHGETRFI